MCRRKLWWVAGVVLPAFVLTFMATVFGSGIMNSLPVGVVDFDFSATSRRVVRTVAAVPTLRIVTHYANEAEARNAVRRGEIYGFFVVPPRFEADVSISRPTTLRYYYHYALMSVGGELYAAFERILRTVAAAPILTTGTALGVGERRIEEFLIPVTSADYATVNPSLDYEVYLSHPFYHVMLQVLVVLLATYTLGCELRDHTAREWLAVAEGDVLAAVVGKLLPLTLLGGVWAAVGDLVMFGPVHIPRLCPMWQILLNSQLLVVASVAVAIVVTSLFPRLWMSASLASMFASLGATMCGVTFPLKAMDPWARVLAQGFPMMHFVRLSQLQIYGGLEVSEGWRHYAALLSIIAVGVVCLPLLRSRIIRTR